MPCFRPIFVDFQNEASGLCVTDNLIYKDVNGEVNFYGIII